MLATPLLAALTLSLTAAPNVTSPEESPPNVLIVLVDDWGIDLLEAYGTGDQSFFCIDRPPTPNIDSLVSTGVTFRNAWAMPVCSPTRASLLTGRFPYLTGMGDIVRGDAETVNNPVPPDTGLPSTEFTLPEMLDQAFADGLIPDYQTGVVGKWHLGPELNSPSIAGFDEYYISYANLTGNESYCRWFRNANGTRRPTLDYATTASADDSIQFINSSEAAEKPWLLYLAFHSGHSPFHMPPANLAPDYFVRTDTDMDGITDACVHNGRVDCDTLPVTADSNGNELELCPGVSCPPSPCDVACELLDFDAPVESVRGRRPYYEAMIQAMDTELGRVLANVDLEETLVILLGDNGTPGKVTWVPFLGNRLHGIPGRAKATVYEGGVRVPFIVAGKGVNGLPRMVDDLVSVVDIFDTVMDVLCIDETQFTIPPTPTRNSISFDHVLKDVAGTGRDILFSEFFAPNLLGQTVAMVCPTSTNIEQINFRRAARDARYKLMVTGPTPGGTCMDEEELFFDLDADPFEEACPLDLQNLNAQEAAAYMNLRAEIDSRPLP